MFGRVGSLAFLGAVRRRLATTANLDIVTGVLFAFGTALHVDYIRIENSLIILGVAVERANKSGQPGARLSFQG